MPDDLYLTKPTSNRQLCIYLSVSMIILYIYIYVLYAEISLRCEIGALGMNK